MTKSVLFRRFARRRGACLLGLGTALAACGAQAQDYPQVQPKTPAPHAPATIALPPLTAPLAPARDQTLLPALKGLKLVDRLDKIVRDGVDAPGLSVDPALGLLDDPAIRQALTKHLGKPFAASDIAAITRLIVNWYRSRQHPVIDVIFPQQKISSGTVQVLVVEYRAGQIRVEGNRWFARAIIRDGVHLQTGEAIDFNQLRQDLNALNRNPFRRVDAVFARSDVVGDTDLVLQTQDRLPLRVYATYDNTGLPVTGRDRYSAGINWGDAFGTDTQLSYQFTTGDDLLGKRNRGPGQSNDPAFLAHAVDVLSPLLPNGDMIHVFGSYMQQVPDVGANFGQVGRNYQLSIRYQHDLPGLLTGLTHQLEFGFDYKNSNNNLAFGGASVYANATEVDQFVLSYNATLGDRWGQSALKNDLVYGPGGLTGGNTTAAFQNSGVAGASAAYVYDRVQLTRQTNLPYHLTWLVRATGQTASNDLILSEQLGAGGVDSVRGYDERAESGSEGVLASTELYTPALSLAHALLGKSFNDAGQLLAFYDYGRVSDEHAQQKTPTRAELASVGFGARYNLDRYLSVRFDYGWQLERLPGAAHLGNLAMVSVTTGY
jgi:hemolysin activation/secretion protein